MGVFGIRIHTGDATGGGREGGLLRSGLDNRLLRHREARGLVDRNLQLAERWSMREARYLHTSYYMADRAVTRV